MNRVKFQKYGVSRVSISGYSLIELIAVISIIAILVSVAIPSMSKFIRYTKYQNYCNSLELLIKQAKILAMERSTNIGICVYDERTVKIVDMGTNRGAGACVGTTLRILQIEPGDTSFVRFAGSSASLDPRGFAIFNGNVCVHNSEKNVYFLVCISRFGGIRVETGQGECRNCGD
ncbi:GspH/FimT family pseudopilin [Thermodesulfobacterium thermophilum]|uniref:GspH/FimT family pseudopilin n=1 Tax=Thermodesulfobacterium thermophilum TaxID=886 RepID=UPI0003B39B09|nr:prepilin-type N-terminal cleavage/methylation domain-containing protein [Thermodesulfobacterium thermophilum]